MPSTGKSLGELASRVDGSVFGNSSRAIEDVTHDSRGAGPKTLFVAVRGARHDGHDYVAEVAAHGGGAAAVETRLDVEIDQIVVDDTRRAMGPLASAVHGDPSSQVDVVGVTGTNGKTTVTHYIESLMTTGGRATGLIGTIRTRLGDTVLASARTTPEATDFQRLLAQMRDLGAEVVAAEISSHALEMSRVNATKFAVAAFTNLSQDHLDFHGDMASYRRAKERLFHEFEVGTAVINVDDEVGREIARSISGPLLRTGVGGDIRAEAVDTSLSGTRFDLITPDGEIEVHSPLVGSFNVENCLVAVACCLALGLSLETVAAGLSSLAPVPGRFERVSTTSEPTVIVDYAHTPKGIHEVIALARQLTTGRVIAVAGAGGDRDRAKRPMMGAAAAEADVTVLTSDNPRSEEPASILAQMAAGARRGDVVVEVDRRRAIETAIGMAGPGDVVLILGKGHETGQEIDGVVLAFDDREVASAILASSPSSADPGPISGSMSR
ncbi:MAG: UDP-N-acetylmuramoyl-L-alanyl-D-glutamate--2,6-diaminopimelate ligase [Acidimicrobiia bacterium]